jgi:phosphate uptake regulator
MSPKEIAHKVYPASENEPQRAALIKAIESYGKERKVYGTVNMARLVKQMRDAQKAYFQHRTQERLKESIKMEEQVDRAVSTILKHMS